MPQPLYSSVTQSGRPAPLSVLLALLGLLLAALPALAQPTISSFSPSSGPSGSTVTISGSGFTGVTSVRFGELSAQFTVNSSSQITAVVPRAASTQLINVTTSAGYDFSASAFTVTRGSSLTYTQVATGFAGVSGGTNAAPAVADLDGDGRLDLLVGLADGTISRYEQNIVNGTTFTALGSLRTGGNTVIDIGTEATVAIVDLDGDGLYNLVLGRGDGTVSEYEQTSVGAGTFDLVQNNLSGISTPSNTVTSMTDLDGDGNLELLVGKGDGITSHSEQNYVNTDDLYRIDTNFNQLQLSGNAAPFCVDLDGNGRIDILMGVNGGSIYRFEQAAAGSFTVSQVTSSFNGISAGGNAKPCVTDIDGDGLLDLLVGRGDGTITRYEQSGTAPAPTISGFTPTSGPVGTTVTVTGTNLGAVSAVTVNGTAGTITGQPSTTSFTFTVGTGSTTGVIGVTTAGGSANSSGSFTVSGAVTLATVTTATPGAVTSSSAGLGGNVTSAGGGTVTERGIVYLAGNGTPTTSNTKVAIGSGTGTFSQTVSGLPGNTLYSVRAYAINGAGTSYGNTQTFTTGNTPPTATDDSYTVNEDSGPTTFSVLGNDSDPDAGTTLTITAVTQPANGSVTFTGTAVTFTPTLNFNGSTSFTYTIADGNGGTDVGTVTVTVSAVNDAPVVTVPGTQTTAEDVPFAFSSGAGNAIAVSDVDAGSGQVEVYLQATQGAIYLSTTAGLTFLAGDGTADASMTFRGTISSVNTALNNMSFAPNAGFNGAAALQVQANDLGNTGSGGARSDSRTVNITVTPVNDAPVLTASGGSTGFTTGGGAVAVDGGLTASDADNATLASGTVSITTGFVSGQDVLAFSNTSSTTFGNITASYAAGTGVLTLTSSGATATVAQWQAALRAVSYNNTSATPTGSSRTVSFRVYDGALNSNVVTKTISLTTPAPVVTSLTPSSGPVGTSVVIAGSNFSGATAVRFNGLAAASYVVNSGTQITAVVAAGTTTGPFTVTTPAGVSNNNGTFTVTNATTSTTLTSSVNPARFGQSVTLTVTVDNTNGSADPTGTVTFRDGSTTLGTGTLNASGVATFSTSTLGVGSHPLTAVYGGASGFDASTSAVLSQLVNAASTTTTVSSSVNPSTFGQSVTFTATVVAAAPGGGTPTGTVTFRDGSTTLGTGTLNASGVATFSTSALAQGSRSITAVYGATTNYAASTSAALTQVINAPPLPALTGLSPTSGPVGTSVTISGTNLSGATSVSFNGVVQTTISNNTATGLTVLVPAGASTGEVEVTTAAGTSNALTFTVTPPAPVVTSVAGPVNGTYRLGQNLDFLVSFDQPVTVSTAGGTPTLTLTVGSTARTAGYLSGSTASTLTFRYTVQAGDLDANGVTLGGSIALNGGTLRNATGTNALLTLNNVGPLTGVLVDGVVPTVTVTTTGPNPSSSSAIPVTIAFSEPVTGLTAASLTVTNGTKGVLSGSGATYTITVTASASGAVTVQVPASVAQDAAGNPNAASNTLSVTYTPPPVAISSFTPTSGAAGTVVTITGNGFTGTTAVTINNGNVASYTVDSNTQITATVAANNTTGLIRVTAPAGTGVSSTNFIVGPAVTSVNIITANGTYRTGQQLQFNAVFSQSITVNTTGGMPSLDVTVGSTVRQATYTGTAGGTAAFRYTIVAGDLDTDGVTLGGSINLNGGTIRNSGGADADPDLNNVGFTAGLLVDAVAPTVVISSSAGASGGSTATSPIPITITFSEPVTSFVTGDVAVTGATKSGFGGSGTTYTVNLTPTGSTVTVNVAAGVARDAANNDNEAAPTFTIQYLPAPAISSFTPTSGAAGTTVSLTGTNLTGATAITFTGSSGNVVTAGFTVVSGTSITGIVVPAGASTGPLTVTTPGGTSAASATPFRVAPTISGLSVAAELPGQAVGITGQNFTSGSTVTFGGVAAGSVTYVSPTSLTATVPAGAAAGNRAVVVTTPNGSSTGSPAFEVLQVYRTATASGCLSTTAVTLDGTGGANSWSYLRLPAAQGGAVVAAIENTVNLGSVTAGVLAQGTSTSQPVRQDGGGRRYLDRNFYLTATNPAFAGQSVRVRFFGLSSELSRLTAADPAATAATLNVSQYSGPNEDCDLTNNSGTNRQRLLDAPATVLGGADWFTAEVTVPDHFSEFYLTGASQPLPVQLTSFTATAAGPAAVALAWTTAQELNSAYFEVERSVDGRAFAAIGRVEAAGRSTSARSYQLPDPAAPTAVPVLYYRLRTVDQDGTFAYSAVQTVRRAATAGSLTLYPNPTRTAATLTGAAPGGLVQLFDAYGRVLLTTRADAAGTARLTLPPACATGVYLVRSGRQATRLLVE